ncbi:MAG: SH3 domain-containing protein [Acidobacteriota bacterium]|nr:SH3 domain-containing protein [Acidobacteriota bacterium]
MKQCPVCKTTYTDDSLRFCLTDGASLMALPEAEKTVQMSRENNSFRISVPPDSVPTIFPPVNSPNQSPPRKGKGLLIVAVLVILLLIGAAGLFGIIAYLSLRQGESNNSRVVLSNVVSPNSNSSNQAQISSQTPTNDETAALKEKLANLEKQVENQKNQKQNTNSQPFSAPNQSANPKARVNSPGDGFLALRTEPDADSGERIAKIPHGETIELIDCQRFYTIIGNRRGRWCQVSYGGQSGWVFDAFLIYR